ncbi:carbon-nitrogen hydrolase family protein [Streptomyces somaliensis DSM 40738]|uniref:Carbon-nitrogen hydrolase family protein n=1 Tax=Streptomyces somaliensis (strain ATCC 33201 / DSM 40738 / JCM 12659 / KCTC 9044 / NCTC 11332 / NRRL B-12077 / IP 733) TaxID=1134445 RepID=A0AA44DBL3_STRE0|nr:carbon-nitrogen hydrolase family protein [Streptomyces somaliensis]MCQ0022594.1 carbon-nitrogen hydrolase family protein [Streptomyces somaliensis DSM 40738]NKY13484.1 carbon-nitrogen hydrolase family protein [Streptomyces somaliensis DSM 40738]
MIVSAAQFTAVPGDVGANVRTVAEMVRASAGARVVVFAELALTGYEPGLIAADPGLWLTADDPRLDPVREACRAAGAAAVVNGPAPGRERGHRPYLTSYVIGPDGTTLARYDKQHLYEAEREVFAAGTADGRFTLDGHRFALATCFDSHFPGLGERAAADGCRVYLASSLYGTGDGVRERAAVYPAVARRSGLYVVLANHVGAAGPWTGCGRSAVWGPDGGLLAEADPVEPGLVRAAVGRRWASVLVEPGRGGG